MLKIQPKHSAIKRAVAPPSCRSGAGGMEVSALHQTKITIGLGPSPVAVYLKSDLSLYTLRVGLELLSCTRALKQGQKPCLPIFSTNSRHCVVFVIDSAWPLRKGEMKKLNNSTCLTHVHFGRTEFTSAE